MWRLYQVPVEFGHGNRRMLRVPLPAPFGTLLREGEAKILESADGMLED
jgi:hypothetical protein